MSDRKTGFPLLNAKNSHFVTYDVMITYMHEKTNILLSILSIFSFLFLWFQPEYTRLCIFFNLLCINWASIETYKFSRNAMNAYLLYSCFIYRHVQAFFLYRNKSYIFLILGLAKIESVLLALIHYQVISKTIKYCNIFELHNDLPDNVAL